MSKPVVYAGGILALLGISFVLSGFGQHDHEADAKVKARKGKQTMVQIHVFNKEGKLVGPIESPKLVLTDAEWKKKLSPDQFKILRSKGTERPFCGILLDNKKEGVYTCAACGLPLFSSDSKFHSGTGWPSFFRPVAETNVAQRPDHSHGQVRTEIDCPRCGGHLGHVFDDGPKPTGLRFCLNSESLNFTTSDKLATLADPILEKPTDDVQGSKTGEKEMATAVFAGGCFWCTEAAFEQLEGVADVESGYSGGAQQTADYESVSSGQTGHAEAIRVTYNANRISYDQLLDVFFDAHDPTQLNRQGADVGTQYRSAIFFANDQQKKAAEAKIEQLTKAKAFHRPIVTTLEPLTSFYTAEAYHQDYARNNPFQPYIVSHSTPKACKVRAKHPNLIKSDG